MQKRILAALLASAAVLSFTGCTSSDSNTNNNTNDGGNNTVNDGGNDADNDAGNDNGGEANVGGDNDPGEEGTLSILTWNGNSDTKTMIEFFLESKGYPASAVTFVGVGDNGEGARDGYQQYLLGDGDADLMIFDAGWTPMYINNDEWTAPYDSIGLSKSDFPDAFTYTLAVGTDDNGVFKATSFQATPGAFVYRADLAKEYLGVETPDQMHDLISDWNKFAETGKKINEASGGTAGIQATEGGMWEVFQYNRSKAWVVDGKLEMDNAVDFYDIAKDMKDSGALAGVPQWEAPWYAAIKDGTALGDFVPTWGLTVNEGSILFNFTDGDEALGAHMAICEGPSSYYWGGSYMGVSTKCNNPKLAKEFIEFFCKDADSMKAYAEKTGDYVNSEKVMSSLTASNKLLNGQDHYAVLTTVMGKLDLDGKITSYDSVIKGHFNDSVNGYLEGTYATKEDAIEAFKDNVAASFPELVID